MTAAQAEVATTGADNELLRVSDLRVRFGTGPGAVRAVDGVSFTIGRGETYALLGESGCGKSMTSLSIMGLVPRPAGRVTSGRIELQGEDLLSLSESRMRRVRGGRVAMIFQEPMTALNPVLTVGWQIAESLRVHQGLRGRGAADRAVELLDSVGIPDPRRRHDEYPHQLSGGMKQRVMIAMALAGEPDLLIADEPTTALDVTLQAQVLELLSDLQRERDMAILLITHDLGVVSGMADRVGVMYAGRIVEQADREPFFARPAHPYSRKLFESLPSADKRHEPLTTIPGSVPDLRGSINACRFAGRCDAVFARCREEEPDLTDLSRGHRVRCHLYTDAGGSAARDGVDDVRDAPPDWEGDTGEVLRVRGLKVHFPITRGVFKRVVGQVRAVDGLDLDIPRGRTLALVGESGCGKTTAGKGIIQLLRPTDGRVDFKGQDLGALGGEALRRARAHFQIIFQDPFSSMNPRMRVGDIVAEGLDSLALAESAQERARRVGMLLEQVGLDAGAADRFPHEFSGGQRQRICIARALAVRPEMIVCDEPTSALDVSVQAQILNLLRQLQADLGLSYLFITHNLAVVSYLAHEVAVMYLGRIVERGPVERVLAEPLHPYTQALLSAVPRIGDGEARAVIRLEGELPSPSAPPVGCHFHPRCPKAMSECRAVYPDAVGMGSGRQVACHLYRAPDQTDPG
ncbi:MAG: dipeptide ABC transporter ATP-binding protein [Gammaproteobacteria bacterium]